MTALPPTCVQNGDGVNGQKFMEKMDPVKDQVHLQEVEQGNAKLVQIVRHASHIAQILVIAMVELYRLMKHNLIPQYLHWTQTKDQLDISTTMLGKTVPCFLVEIKTGTVKAVLNLKTSLVSSYLNLAKQITETGQSVPKITKENTKADLTPVAKDLQAVIQERQGTLIRDKAVAQGPCKNA